MDCFLRSGSCARILRSRQLLLLPAAQPLLSSSSQHAVLGPVLGLLAVWLFINLQRMY
jgi:hypothetical protein